MKKAKSAVSVIIVTLLVFGAFSMCFSASAASYNTGDIIEFGTYPQTKVTDYSLISALNNQAGSWVSYLYYSGSGNETDGDMRPNDYMRFCDVTYNGKKYRGVTFDQYRPKRTGFLPLIDNSNQDENGYYTDNIYWFEFEPIKWRILDPSGNLVMSEMLLNSIAFNNYVYCAEGSETAYGDSARTFYCNNYVKSSLRTWLNNNFYDLAFTGSEKSNILTTTLYDGSDGTISDNVFILSYSDSMNSHYGFSSGSDAARSRMAKGTDYAKCQGLYVDEGSGYSYWRLRTQGRNSLFTCDVKYDGSVHDDYRAFATACGVRPVLRLTSLDAAAVNSVQSNDYYGSYDSSSSYNNNSSSYDSSSSVDISSESDNAAAADETSQESGSDWWIILIAAVVVLAVIAVIVILMLKMKKSGSRKSNAPGNFRNNRSIPAAAAPAKKRKLPENQFCIYCGKPLEPGSKFCTGCGRSVE